MILSPGHRSSQPLHDPGQLFPRAARRIRVARLQPGKERLAATGDVERQKAVVAIIAVKEATFLATVNLVVRRTPGNSCRPSRTTWRSTTRIPSPSSGRSPRTTSWNHSKTTANALPIQNTRTGLSVRFKSLSESVFIGHLIAKEDRLGGLPPIQVTGNLERQLHEVGSEFAPERVPAAAPPGFKSSQFFGSLPPAARQPAGHARRSFLRRGHQGASPIPGLRLRASTRTACVMDVIGVRCSCPVFSCSPRHRSWQMAPMRCPVSWASTSAILNRQSTSSAIMSNASYSACVRIIWSGFFSDDALMPRSGFDSMRSLPSSSFDEAAQLKTASKNFKSR